MATSPYKDINAEIARTQQVIADRLNGGQDLTAQLAHYKNLTGKDYTKTGDYQTLQAQKGVNDIYNQQVAAATQAWNVQRDKAVGDINYQKQQVAPQYQGLRNQADVVNLQNAKRLQELMASRGLGASGENVTATVNQNNARQNSLNTLNAQEQQTINDYDHQIANLSNPAELNAQLAQINAQRSQALLDAKNQAQQFAYQQSRDSVADNQWNQQFNYGKSQDALQQQNWQKQFDQDVKQYGQNYALQKMQFDLDKQIQLGNLSIDQARLALAQASAARSGSSSRSSSSKSTSKSSSGSKSTPKLPNTTATQRYLNTLNYFYPTKGKQDKASYSISGPTKMTGY